MCIRLKRREREQQISGLILLRAYFLMPLTHGANKSVLFAQIFDPYEVNLQEFAQIKNGLFADVYKTLKSMRKSKWDAKVGFRPS